MTAARRPCGKHDRYYHVCAACRDRSTTQPAPAAPCAPGGRVRTPIGAPCPPNSAAWNRACNAPDDSPTAYPPARKSNLTTKGAVTL